MLWSDALLLALVVGCQGGQVLGSAMETTLHTHIGVIYITIIIYLPLQQLGQLLRRLVHLPPRLLRRLLAVKHVLGDIVATVAAICKTSSLVYEPSNVGPNDTRPVWSARRPILSPLELLALALSILLRVSPWLSTMSNWM